MPEKISLDLKVVTPLFIGGANPNDAAELRVPSIKGVLRFWHRAFSNGDHEDERDLFGGAGQGEGQSRIRLRISNIHVVPGPKNDTSYDDTKIAYLGFGPIIRDPNLKKSVTIRPYLKPGTSFTLSCMAQQKDDLDKVKRALSGMLLFGGLGSRSRRGFGSMRLESAEPNEVATDWRIADRENLILTIKKIIPATVCNTLPTYTQFSNGSCCLVGPEKTISEAHEWIGFKMNVFRSWKGLKQFQSDHDNMRDLIASGTLPLSPPKRSAFGLPHNYFFTSLGNKKGGVDLMENNKAGRRASPLFIHIQKFENNRACAVLLFLPAQLVPSGKKVTVWGENNVTDMDLDDDFTAITRFLNWLNTEPNVDLAFGRP